MLHLGMVRSPIAHAKITTIDVAQAKAAPGVVAVYTGADLADDVGTMPCGWPLSTDDKVPDYHPVAIGEVNFAGEIVAVVVARSAAAARDATELVDVEYEDLPVVLDIEAAAAGAPFVHPHFETNVSTHWVFDSAEAGTGADVRQAIEVARRDGIVLERTFREQRLIPAFMEPRSYLVDPTGEQIVFWSSTQVPHFLRVFTAIATSTPESKIRVIAPDVGGGFGGKLQVTPEEFITFTAAKKLGKPVKYTETRSESLQSAHHGRDQVQRLTLAATKEGKVTALHVDLLTDLGAYCGLVGPAIPILGAYMFNGIYKFDAYRFETRNVFTNKVRTDAYRGAGRPEATYAIERLMDDLAAELGTDPLALRAKNWIRAEEFPFTTVAGFEYDSGNYEAATAKAKELFDYDGLRAEQAERRANRDPVQLGIGISTYTEQCGLAPSRILGRLNYIAGGWEHAQVRMLPLGTVEVVVGTSPHGQGHETAWSQIVADKLGVAFEDVEVLHGDTAVAQRGLDTYGSRSLVVGATAVLRAADKVIEKAKPIAAHMLEANENDLEYAAGRFRVKGTDQGKSLAEIAFATLQAHDLPDGIEPNLDSSAAFDPDVYSYPHGTHLVAVEVDTETGAVALRSYVAVDDIGKVVNPLIVEGQVHGGLTQGIAQALFEEAVYDENGTLTTGSFVDYLVPSASDLINFVTERTESPALNNELGAKGVGEAGTIASTPAVVNGILDALRPLGVSDIEMPCTPMRVWKAIQGARPLTEESATPAEAQPHFDSEGAVS
jgi:carbon-monoxide dehydrogenase large subunit